MSQSKPKPKPAPMRNRRRADHPLAQLSKWAAIILVPAASAILGWWGTTKSDEQILNDLRERVKAVEWRLNQHLDHHP